MLPFSHEQFVAVFASYNVAIWPAQVITYLLGLAVLVVVVRSKGGPVPFAVVALAALWAWTGIAYHWLHFALINPAAWLFGAAFVLQAVVLAWSARRLRFGRAGPRRTLGLALIGYALLLYPALGLLAGYEPASLPMFGVTPCPLVLFTLGLLLLTVGARWWVWIIPLTWSLIGGTAAFLLHVPQDWILLLSGPAALLVLRRERAPHRHNGNDTLVG